MGRSGLHLMFPVNLEGEFSGRFGVAEVAGEPGRAPLHVLPEGIEGQGAEGIVLRESVVIEDFDLEFVGAGMRLEVEGEGFVPMRVQALVHDLALLGLVVGLDLHVGIALAVRIGCWESACGNQLRCELTRCAPIRAGKSKGMYLDAQPPCSHSGLNFDRRV